MYGDFNIPQGKIPQLFKLTWIVGIIDEVINKLNKLLKKINTNYENNDENNDKNNDENNDKNNDKNNGPKSPWRRKFIGQMFAIGALMVLTKVTLANTESADPMEEIENIRKNKDRLDMVEMIYDSIFAILYDKNQNADGRDMIKTTNSPYNIDGYWYLLNQLTVCRSEFEDIKKNVSNQDFYNNLIQNIEKIFGIWSQIANVNEYSLFGMINDDDRKEKEMEVINNIKDYIYSYIDNPNDSDQEDIINALMDIDQWLLMDVVSDMLRYMIPLTPNLHWDYYESLARQYIHHLPDDANNKILQSDVNERNIDNITSNLFGQVPIANIIWTSDNGTIWTTTRDGIYTNLNRDIQYELKEYIIKAKEWYDEAIDSIENNKEQIVVDVIWADYCAVMGLDKETYTSDETKSILKKSTKWFDENSTKYSDILKIYKEEYTDTDQSQIDFLAYLELKVLFLEEQLSQEKLYPYQNSYPGMTNIMLVQSIQGMANIWQTYTIALQIIKDTYSTEYLHNGLVNGMLSGMSNNGKNVWDVWDMWMELNWLDNILGMDAKTQKILLESIKPTFFDIMFTIVGAGVAAKIAKTLYNVARTTSRIQKVLKSGHGIANITSISTNSAKVIWILSNIGWFTLEASTFTLIHNTFLTIFGFQSLDDMTDYLTNSQNYAETMAFMGIFKIYMSLFGSFTQSITNNTRISKEKISMAFVGMSIPIEVWGMLITGQVVSRWFEGNDWSFREPTMEEFFHAFALVLGFRWSRYLRPVTDIKAMISSQYGVIIEVTYKDWSTIKLWKNQDNNTLIPIGSHTSNMPLSRQTGPSMAEIYLMGDPALDANNCEFRLKKAIIATNIDIESLYTNGRPTEIGKQIILAHLYERYNQSPPETIDNPLRGKIWILTWEFIPDKILLKNWRTEAYANQDINDIEQILTIKENPQWSIETRDVIDINSRRLLVEQYIVWKRITNTIQISEWQKSMFENIIIDFKKIIEYTTFDNQKYKNAVNATDHIFRNIINVNLPHWKNVEKILHDLIEKNKNNFDTVHNRISYIISKPEITMIEKIEMRWYFALYREYNIQKTKDFIKYNIWKEDLTVRRHLSEKCKTIPWQSSDVIDVFVRLLTAVGIDYTNMELLNKLFAYRIKSTESTIVKLMLSTYWKDRKLWKNIIENGSLEDAFGVSLDFESLKHTKTWLQTFFVTIALLEWVEIIKVTNNWAFDSVNWKIITLNWQEYNFLNAEVKDSGKEELKTANITIWIKTANWSMKTIELQFKTNTREQINNLIHWSIIKHYAHINWNNLIVDKYINFWSYIVKESVDLNHNPYKLEQQVGLIFQQENRWYRNKSDDVIRLSQLIALKTRESALTLDYTRWQFAQGRDLLLQKTPEIQQKHILSIQYTLLESLIKNSKDLTQNERQKINEFLAKLKEKIEW